MEFLCQRQHDLKPEALAFVQIEARRKTVSIVGYGEDATAPPS